MTEKTMVGKRMVEVRFDCGLHGMQEEQALGMLRGLAEYAPIVGLGFEGKAAAILEADEADADAAAEHAVRLAGSLGLTVSCTQTMTVPQYEAAAWGEVDLDE